jgi:nucleotide-binding universal stress UspA family protein
MEHDRDREVRTAVHVRRILIGLDGSAHSRRALEAAVELARVLEAEVEGLFVEEDSWHRPGLSGGGRVVGAYTGTVRTLEPGELGRELGAAARRLARLVEEAGGRLRLTSSFRVERGRPDAVILGAAGSVDLITVGCVGRAPGKAGRLGRTARALIERSDRPVLLLGAGADLGRRIVLVHESGETSERAFALSLQLAGRWGVPLEVLTAEQSALHRAAASDDREGVRVHRVDALTPEALVRLVGPRSGTLVVVSRGSRLLAASDTESTILRLRSPLLLV